MACSVLDPNWDVTKTQEVPKPAFPSEEAGSYLTGTFWSCWELVSSLPTEPLKVKPLQHSAGLLCPQAMRYLSALPSSTSLEGAQIRYFYTAVPWTEKIFLEKKEGGTRHVSSTEKMIHAFLFTWKSLIRSPIPFPHLFPKKRFQLCSLGVSERNKMSVFSFTQRIFLNICSVQASGREGYFITVHLPSCLKQPRTHTCGTLHKKCSLALELNSKLDQLSSQPKPSY